jgi:hypothetical protein
MFDEIRPEGSLASPPDKLAREKARYAEKKAMKLATGQRLPERGS